MNIETLVSTQRNYFRLGATKSLSFRLSMLSKLKDAIKQHEEEILKALYEDLGKSAYEGYITEMGMVFEELKYMLHHLPKLMEPERVKTALTQFPAKTYRYPEPYGVTLIMSPWNYPFLLTIDPLIAALAAGNTAVIKPSAYAPYTSAVIKKLLSSIYEESYVAVVEGGREVNQALLDQSYDYIFFTGGKDVGQLVLQKAALHLTPVTLELGGKSPCIVDETANLSLAARRIVFGKFLNAGQTCVAPDYCLVQESIKDQLLPLLVEEVKKQYGADPFLNNHFGKVINQKHFERLQNLIKGETIVLGGTVDPVTRRVAPTILDHVTLDHPVMQEEIFGPILPILTYQTREEAKAIIDANPTPLALYLFTNSKEAEQEFLHGIPFGGGCLNDTILHLASANLGFGGVGSSGMGQYHGKFGFDTFTHYKSILKRPKFGDLYLRYSPYKESNLKLLKKFMK